MKCKHGLTVGTCALCLKYKQTNLENEGMLGNDNLVQQFRDKPIHFESRRNDKAHNYMMKKAAVEK